MAALLTLVKVARRVRDRARAVTDLLPKMISEPLLRPEQEVSAFFEGLGIAGSSTPRQAEEMLSRLYSQVELLESRLQENRITSFVQRRAVSAFREAVVDLEFLMVPDRERDCQMLGVTRRDDAAMVKSKFRALARRHHPDVTGGDTRRMEELNRAYKAVLRMRPPV
jgi:hypothetical protein